MDLKNSYFSITSPFTILGRWLHPFHRFMSADIRNKNISIRITRRGKKALQARNTPLYVEMQLYLSCMVKKRVLFHEQTELQSEKINDCLSLAFRTVVSTACDPVEFANNFPVKEELRTKATSKLSPRSLCIDYSQNRWTGEFEI